MPNNNVDNRYMTAFINALMHIICLAVLGLLGWEASQIYRIGTQISGIEKNVENLSEGEEKSLEVYNKEIYQLKENIVQLNAYIIEQREFNRNAREDIDQLLRLAMENFDNYQVDIKAGPKPPPPNMPHIQQRAETFEDYDNKIRGKIRKK